MLRIKINCLVLFVIIILFSSQIFAGAPTTSIIINGPGIPVRGIIINGSWPGGTSFIDEKLGPVPAPPTSMTRYVLAGQTDSYSWWYTVLYVWDLQRNQALVYLPSPSELGFRINYGSHMEYEKKAGKWYRVSDPQMVEAIQKTLPKVK